MREVGFSIWKDAIGGKKNTAVSGSGEPGARSQGEAVSDVWRHGRSRPQCTPEEVRLPSVELLFNIPLNYSVKMTHSVSLDCIMTFICCSRFTVSTTYSHNYHI